MKKIKQSIKNFNNNQKGFFSILFVILAFIAVLIVTAMLDIMKESYTVNEVQGVMDVAGVSALNASVDDELLRQEIFDYKEDVAKNVFREIVEKRIGASERISSYKIMNLEVSDQLDSSFGLGEGNVKAQQLFIDSTILLRVETSQIFDLIPSAEKVYFRSYNNDTFKVTVSGQTEDGKTELIVRSVSRLVYR